MIVFCQTTKPKDSSFLAHFFAPSNLYWYFKKMLNRMFKSSIIKRSFSSWEYETIAIHAGQEKCDPTTNSRAVPICKTFVIIIVI